MYLKRKTLIDSTLLWTWTFGNGHWTRERNNLVNLNDWQTRNGQLGTETDFSIDTWDFRDRDETRPVSKVSELKYRFRLGLKKFAVAMFRSRLRLEEFAVEMSRTRKLLSLFVSFSKNYQSRRLGLKKSVSVPIPTVWQTHCPIDWQTDWFTSCLTISLIILSVWLTDFNWLHNLLNEWETYWLTDLVQCLTDWLTSWFGD